MKTIFLTLLGVLIGKELYSLAPVRNATHVLLGRPFIQGVKIIDGQIVAPQGVIITNCIIENTSTGIRVEG